MVEQEKRLVHEAECRSCLFQSSRFTCLSTEEGFMAVTVANHGLGH